MSTDRASSSRTVVVAVATPLLVLAWLIVPAYLVFGAAVAGAAWLGEQPSPAEQAQAVRLLWAAAAAAIGFPLIGFVIGMWARRPGLLWAFGVMTALGLVAAAVVLEPQLRDAREAWQQQQYSRSPVHCQEHSGGDNRCPGG